MARRKAQRVEHQLLTKWCAERGHGAIAELADAAGVSWTSMQAVICFGADPGSAKMLAIASRTGLPLQALVEETARCHRKAFPDEEDAIERPAAPTTGEAA